MMVNIIKVVLCIMIVWPAPGLGQQSFFLDTLFKYDLSKINEVEYRRKKSEIKRLNHDWGLRAGVNVTNSFQDEIGTGLSTRIYAKADVLSGGYFDNAREVAILRNQIQIDSLRGLDRANAHNYGIFYDYVIYLYNVEKLKAIDLILGKNKGLKETAEQLYYNKLIDYQEVLATQNTSIQYQLLQEAQLTYNKIFSEMLHDTILPTVSPSQSWDIDFYGIVKSLDKDTGLKLSLELQEENLEIKYEKNYTPTLSISAGFDISRHRPYFGVNLSTNIRAFNRQNVDSKKLELQNDSRLALIQKKKEILNLQYEHRYKEKQIEGMQIKLEEITEELRKFAVKREVLSLKESHQEEKLKINLLLVNYELIDLRQQQMLLLLQIKSVIPKVILGTFIQERNQIRENRKFAGKRYMLMEENKLLNAFDQQFLDQNEIKLISAAELLELENTVYIDPDQIDTRVAFEMKIIQEINQKGGSQFIIKSIESLKNLELRTIQQKEFNLTSITK